ncbi:MAG: division/cell wall cluster transcriptional repressor MraZ [Candidatus Berkelbacteria bacterium]|nr:MAG: division/cell wall cluster transcriptional repressor MraZ [Candidatus Berkelbacteria bacterium]QQG51496.1 MAG: division/cell wall cluster transcriptional repressor MraZ [Candidatus Berkelbacteria bacterium]
MLIGEFTHNLDAKGRLSVPAKFRSELGSSAIVTRGLDKCLFLYPKAEWETMATRLANLPISSSNARAFARMMLSGAMEVEIDKQGRALLPGYLRDYAGIKGPVMVTGVFNRAEIWDKQTWDAYSKQAAVDNESNAEKLTEWEL